MSQTLRPAGGSTPDKTVIDRTDAGKCSNCGKCCTDLIPISDGELERIVRYAKEHHLEEHRQAPFWQPNAVDMTCPFRNQKTGKCDIYPVRPEICRSFICSMGHDNAIAVRDKLHEKYPPRSLRWEAFGNPEQLIAISVAVMKGHV